MAFVLSSVSGNLISAASAGFAPTNSGDVSAIASAYQVVSATATQLYAGTAYVTSVNSAPLSASRAGNAANASLANSAWYDGTGRLISSLPDSATVSSIASGYAESAVSSKQDTLTFGYDSSNNISSIDGSALAGGGVSYSAGAGIDITSNVISAKVDGTTIDTNASGELTVIGGGGGTQADWDESDPTDPSYIENKPTPKTLTAGTGISISEGVGTITISSNVTAPVQDVTVNGTSVVSNGVAAITTPTVDQTYDASSANAQSGIAVAEGISDAIGDLPTNLTSAQIQALKEALGVDETVLWEGSSTPPSDDTQLTLSITFNETVENFKYVDVYWVGDHDNRQITRCYVTSGYFFFGTRWPENSYSGNWFMMSLSGNGTSGTRNGGYKTAGSIGSFSSYGGGMWGSGTIWKVVGVHRIASN